MIELGISRIRPAIERRQQSATDVLIASIQASARSVVDSAGTAAVESAAGSLSRAFASAAITGPDWARRSIGPVFLSQVGRQLVRAGQSMHVIEVSADGALEFQPCSSWNIEGAGASPSTWIVEATVNSPNRAITRRLPFGAVVFTTWGSLAGQPYRGRGPLAFASVSARLQVEVEKSMGDEASGPLAQILPIPADGGDDSDDDPTADLKADIASAQGKAVLLETTSAGWSEGRSAAPRRDWIAARLGPAPTPTLATIMETGFSQMLSAMGVPPPMFSAGDASGQRESYRRYFSLTVEPLSILLAAELSLKLETPISLSFSGRFSGDLAGRARAFQSMVGAGMELAKAAGLAGLMVAED